MGRGHEIILRKDISYGKILFSGVHVFMDDMSYESLMLGHVLVEYMSSEWHMLQDNVFYWKACLTG